MNFEFPTPSLFVGWVLRINFAGSYLGLPASFSRAIFFFFWDNFSCSSHWCRQFMILVHQFSRICIISQVTLHSSHFENFKGSYLLHMTLNRGDFFFESA
jgi:hypothetical protein